MGGRFFASIPRLATTLLVHLPFFTAHSAIVVRKCGGELDVRLPKQLSCHELHHAPSSANAELITI
jgi:hypothetical protein